MDNRVLCAIMGTLTRPGTTFRAISDNPDHYFKSSVVIFAVVCLVLALLSITTWPEPDNGTFVDFTGDALVYSAPFIHTFLFHFLTHCHDLLDWKQAWTKIQIQKYISSALILSDSDPTWGSHRAGKCTVHRQPSDFYA